MAIWGRILSRKIGGRHYDRGIGEFDKHMYADAVESFTAALAEPHMGSALTARLSRFYLGECYTALGMELLEADRDTDDAALALEHLQRAADLRPGYADLHFNLGRAFLKTGQSLRAIASLSKALDINPNYARAALQMGITYYTIGRREEAFLYAVRATKLDKSFRCEWLVAADEAHEAGDTDEALKCLERIGDTPRDGAIVHAEQAAELCRDGHLAQAVVEYRKALAIQPFYADVRNELGLTLFALGSYTEAVEEFSLAVHVNPRYIDGRLNLAHALEHSGRREEAARQFDIVLAADSEHPIARERLAALKANRPFQNEPDILFASKNSR